MTEPSITIPGVPTSIRRADYIALTETLGLNVTDLLELRFGLRAIEVEVRARNAEGKLYLDPFGRNQLARHTLTIPVVDDDED